MSLSFHPETTPHDRQPRTLILELSQAFKRFPSLEQQLEVTSDFQVDHQEYIVNDFGTEAEVAVAAYLAAQSSSDRKAIFARLLGSLSEAQQKADRISNPLLKVRLEQEWIQFLVKIGRIKEALAAHEKSFKNAQRKLDSFSFMNAFDHGEFKRTFEQFPSELAGLLVTSGQDREYKELFGFFNAYQYPQYNLALIDYYIHSGKITQLQNRERLFEEHLLRLELDANPSTQEYHNTLILVQRARQGINRLEVMSGILDNWLWEIRLEEDAALAFDGYLELIQVMFSYRNQGVEDSRQIESIFFEALACLNKLYKVQDGQIPLVYANQYLADKLELLDCLSDAPDCTDLFDLVCDESSLESGPSIRTLIELGEISLGNLERTMKVTATAGKIELSEEILDTLVSLARNDAAEQEYYEAEFALATAKMMGTASLDLLLRLPNTSHTRHCIAQALLVVADENPRFTNWQLYFDKLIELERAATLQADYVSEEMTEETDEPEDGKDTVDWQNELLHSILAGEDDEQNSDPRSSLIGALWNDERLGDELNGILYFLGKAAIRAHDYERFSQTMQHPSLNRYQFATLLELAAQTWLGGK